MLKDTRYKHRIPHPQGLFAAEYTEKTPMSALLTQAIAGQFEAAFAMFNRCLEACPTEHWDALIAKYPLWQTAYHTLCFVDLYLSPGEKTWQPRTGPGGFHPLGWTELDEEYPSRRFTKDELLAYAALLAPMIRTTIEGETAERLAGESGFSRLTFSRAELHIYALRHVQHHAGQIGARLRALGVDPGRWVKSGLPTA